MQIQAQMPPNGLYKKPSFEDRHPIPWPQLREGDVMYHWRVERVIDVREKMNLPLQWPQNPLWKILQDNLMNGRLTAYNSDRMDRMMTSEEIAGKVNDTVDVEVQVSQENIYETETKRIPRIFDWADIKHYRIMEDWIFDKKLGQMYCRIAYIAPMYQPQAGSLTLPEQPICYVRYADNEGKDTGCFRNLAVNNEIFNRNNLAANMSYDDFFEMRMFASYIIKESNVFDQKLSNYDEYADDPIARLLAGEKVKEKMFEFEHDLWEH
jgi:gliding motility associated protien GldN